MRNGPVNIIFLIFPPRILRQLSTQSLKRTGSREYSPQTKTMPKNFVFRTTHAMSSLFVLFRRFQAGQGSSCAQTPIE